jgi:carboxymethylenebutenolidase
VTAKEIVDLWEKHLEGEFVTKDTEASLETMVDDAEVDHIPHHSGGQGKAALRHFYRDNFIPSWPSDLQMKPLNRVIGDNQLVDELLLTFTHTKRMEWFLPGLEPTHRKVKIQLVVVVQFRDGKLARERIYWDHATVLRQVGLLE